MPAHTDSVSKIVTRYFSAVTIEKFTYDDEVYLPCELKISPNIFTRRMECVKKCGACCPRFSLDYIPSEVDQLETKARERLSRRIVPFNSGVEVWSDLQDDHANHFCRQLDQIEGLCTIHGSHPFSCDFELLRFKRIESKDEVYSTFNHSPFGRGWNMKRIDGERGVLCEWRDQLSDEVWVREIVRKLSRLQQWTDYFGIKTSLPGIISWISGGHAKENADTVSFKLKTGREEGGIFVE